MIDSSKVIEALKDPSFNSKVHIGTPIQIEYEGKKFSLLRAAKHPYYLIIDTPISQGKHIIFDTKKSLVLRFIYDGVVYAFETAILKQFTRPNVLILQYPSQVTYFNLRKNKRIKLLLPIIVAPELKGQRHHAALMDLSEEGCLISIKIRLHLNIGDTFFISMELPDGQQISLLKCEIARVEDYEDNTVYGMQFDTSDVEQTGRINKFLKYCHNICDDEPQLFETEEKERGMFRLGEEIAMEINKKSIKSTIRGWKKIRDEGFLLVDPPKKDENIAVPELETEVFIRCKTKGSIYGTETKFQASMAGNIWVFGFKGEALESSIRTNERFLCIIPTKVIVINKEKKFEEIGSGIINDISMMGVSILTKKPIEIQKDEIAMMNFSLSGFGNIELQKLKLIRNEQIKDHYECAGAFIDIGDKDKERLQQYFDFCHEWSFQ